MTIDLQTNIYKNNTLQNFDINDYFDYQNNNQATNSKTMKLQCPFMEKPHQVSKNQKTKSKYVAISFENTINLTKNLKIYMLTEKVLCKRSYKWSLYKNRIYIYYYGCKDENETTKLMNMMVKFMMKVSQDECTTNPLHKDAESLCFHLPSFHLTFLSSFR